jgi:hypothetical protein
MSRFGISDFRFESERKSRREFLTSAGRWGVLAALVGGMGWLVGRAGATDCAQPACDQCRQFGRCSLPQKKVTSTI